MHPLASALLLGLLWATWHLPAFYIAGTDEYAKPFVSFAINVIALSLVLAAIWRATQSTFLCMLQHAVVNASLVIQSSDRDPGWRVWSPVPEARYLYLMVLIAFVAAVLAVVTRKHGAIKKAAARP